jgi:hypothetical protein
MVLMKTNPISQLRGRATGRRARYPRRVRRRPQERAVILLTLALLAISAFAVTARAQDDQALPLPEITEKEDSVKVRLGEFDMEVGLVLMRGNREFESFVPLVVSIFNRSHKLVRIRKDEFRLYGENGEELPLATVKQVRSVYRLYRQDVEIVTRSGFLSALPGDYRQTNFFPTPGSVGIYAVTLDFRQTFIDFLYFVGRWNQRLRLVAEGNKSRPALEVQFQVTRSGFQSTPAGD